MTAMSSSAFSSADAAEDRHWEDLPLDLLCSIAGRLYMLDYIYSARSAPPGAPPRRLSTDARSPLACPISLPPAITGREASPSSSSTSPTAAPNASPLLPEIRGKLCVGSQFGWLVVLDEFSNVSLLNPLIRSQIHLPPITTLPFIEPIHAASDGVALSMYLFHEQLFWRDFRRISISKVVLSSSPTGSGGDRFTVVAIFDFTKLILFISTSGTYWMSERSTGSATSSIWISAATPQRRHFPLKGSQKREIYTSRYLVEDSSGDLLQIGRFSPCEEEKDMCVDDEMLIMRWDQKEGSRCQLKSSGEHCHFCGNRTKGMVGDVGVYNVEDGS